MRRNLCLFLLISMLVLLCPSLLAQTGSFQLASPFAAGMEGVRSLYFLSIRDAPIMHISKITPYTILAPYALANAFPRGPDVESLLLQQWDRFSFVLGFFENFFDSPLFSSPLPQGEEDLHVDDSQDTVTVTYTIVGTVTDKSGKSLPGVTLSFSGEESLLETEEDGTWSKSGLTGSVTVTPSKDGYVFLPDSIEVEEATGHVDFIGTYGVFGLVKDGSGQGILDVELSFQNGYDLVFTNEDGRWAKGGLAGTVLITPWKEGYAFTPESLTVTGPETNVNFMGTFTEEYSITGTIQDAAGEGVGDVAVFYSVDDAPVVTQEDGHWQIDMLKGIVLITPEKEGFFFTPASLTVRGPTSSVSFTGCYEITGEIKDGSGNGIPGVVVHFGSDEDPVTTDHDGLFRKSGLSGRVSVKPEKGAYVFTPAVHEVEGPDEKIHFTGGYAVAGEIKDELGNPVVGVEICFGDDYPSVTTQEDGRWEKENVSGTVLITPEKRSYSFQPDTYEVDGPKDTVHFTGGFRVSGIVKDGSGMGLAGVEVIFSGGYSPVITAEDGSWSKRALTDTVTVTPVKEGYDFFPQQLEVSDTDDSVHFLEGYTITFADGFSSYWQYIGEDLWVMDTSTYTCYGQSAKSGTITDNEETGLGLLVDIVGDPGILSFYRKVSSEEGFDYLSFSIHGEEVDSWSGELDWEQVSYQLPAGQYALMWNYVKDPSGSSGSDAVWIDNIYFTGTLNTQILSGQVQDELEAGLEGVTIEFSGGYRAVRTDGDGLWSTVVLSDVVSVTPIKPGYLFAPVYQRISPPEAQIDFTGTYEVSGFIDDGAGNGLQGVTLSFSGAYESVVTEEDGTWSKGGLSGEVQVIPEKKGYTFDPINRDVTGPADDINMTSTYRLSGFIDDGTGNGLARAPVTFSEGYMPVITCEDGAWHTDGFIGTVTVTPRKEGFSFKPPSQQVTTPSSEVDFVSSYEISGQIEDYSDYGIGEVEVSFGGVYGSVLTNEEGHWSQGGLQGNVTVTTSREGYIFSPVSREVDGPSTTVNFKGSYALEGTITDGTGRGIEGVEITFTGGYDTVTTDAKGHWSTAGLSGTVLVVPIIETEEYVSFPEEYKVSSADTEVHFVVGYVCSGLVEDVEGRSFEGVEITFTGGYDTVTTDAKGQWKTIGLQGTVTVAPYKDGYSFEPSNQEIMGSTEGMHFIGTYAVSGQVRNEDGMGIEGVSISFAEEYDWVVTDGDGNWYTGGLSGEVLVIPRQDDHWFSPLHHLVSAPAENVDFTVIMVGDGTTYRVEDVDFHMRLAPASTFPSGRRDSRTATVDAAFWVAETQVTYALWYEIRMWALDNGYVFANAGMEGSHGIIGAVPAEGKHEPVTMVNWYDCLIWCNALSEYLGYEPVYTYQGEVIRNPLRIHHTDVVAEDTYGFRLPTLQEWELAARYKGGDRSHGAIEYPVGTGNYWTPGDYASGAKGNYYDVYETNEVAWYNGNTNKTQDVGLKPSTGNGLGLFDMSGNVFEWCFTGVDANRMALGGTWNHGASLLQVGGVIISLIPSSPGNCRGFRFVRTK